LARLLLYKRKPNWLEKEFRVLKKIDMAPKSCDGEVNDGSSSDVNVMEPMETSTGVGLSFLGKRRAETPNPGESEQIADEDGEEYESVEDVVVEDDRIRGGR